MNGLEETKFSLSEESRPPAVGQEEFSFYEPRDTPCAQKSDMDSTESAHYSKEYNGVRNVLEGYNFNSACSDAGDGQEQSSYSSPSSPHKWTRGLQCLLDDMQGTELFQKFLKLEGLDTKCLDFLFACRGVKKTAQNTEHERLLKLVHVLYEKKVKWINAIDDKTKCEIKQKIASKTEVDINIFDEAQRQVELDITNTTYQSFFKSELFLQYLNPSDQEEYLQDRECPVSPAEPDGLPTLHEESELQFSGKLMMRRESLRKKLSRSGSQLSKNRLEAGSFLKSPYSTNYGSYHARYGSHQPNSAQDSELQSLSSDAQTDDTMSQTDCSSVDFSKSRSKQKCTLKNKNLLVNKDNLSLRVIPRTQQMPNIGKIQTTPEEFYDVLYKKLMRVYNEQISKEKLNEKLSSVEPCDSSRSAMISSAAQKSCKPGDFEQTFFFGPTEDNDQDILDRHVSRVFDDLGQTPVLSPVCASPPVARPEAVSNPATLAPQDLFYTNCQKGGLTSPFTARSALKHKRDHDTRSSDSGAVMEWRSDDNLAARPQDSNCPLYLQKPTPTIIRFARDRRSGKKVSSVNDSASSCVDSGISEVCEPAYFSKVTNWLETKPEKEWKNLPTSTVPSRSSLNQKGAYRIGEGEPDMVYPSINRPAAMAAQPVAQDFIVPLRPTPDTTSNLIEAKKKLEEDGKSRFMFRSRHASVAKLRQSMRTTDTAEEGTHRKQKKSLCTLENSSAASNSDTTVVGYSYGQGAVPYLTRYQGKNITLKNFKSLLTKKGNFKYYFKKVENAFGTGTVLEEVSDECAVLPLWEGKVFCVIEAVDDVSTSLEE